MTGLIHNRKALVALTIIVAIVAIVVPTCVMVGCSMGGAMPFGHLDMPSVYGDCGGTYITNTAPSAIVPAGADSLVLALVSAVMAAMVLFRPAPMIQTIRAHASDPPPPPEDPRGERLRL